MKVLVISDSHGRNDDVAGVIRQVGVENFDAIIHCGDVERGDDYVRSLVPYPVYMVSGNNDYNLDLPQEITVDLGGHTVWIVHGHRFQVYRDTRMLRKVAREKGADLVMFGHTHRPHIETENGITLINPGSLSYPRQADRKPTYLMMEIGENGELSFEHHYYKSKFTEILI